MTRKAKNIYKINIKQNFWNKKIKKNPMIFANKNFLYTICYD